MEQFHGFCFLSEVYSTLRRKNLYFYNYFNVISIQKQT
ncbi:MAG: hypothetical protein JWO58_1577 [Chitinophagaceae bacterium]|nr:hypothetical protein [Chitinophagaceae bacterium]